MSDKFPHGTKASHSTAPEFIAVCFDCDWECEAANAMGVAAQHHGRTGHQVHVQVVRTVIWVKP